MKITSKGRYAVLAMVDIAKFGEDAPCNLSHVSVRQNISLSYLEQIFNNFDHYYVLSVGNVDGFVNQGGVLNILRTSDQQRFEINLQRARQNGLSFSSDLLELSRVINQ